MKEIYILSAVGMTASIIGAIPFFNRSVGQSNQTALLNLAENQAKLNTNSNDREISNVGGSNKTEHIIDPRLASQFKIAADEAKSIAMTNVSAQSSDVR